MSISRDSAKQVLQSGQLISVHTKNKTNELQRCLMRMCPVSAKFAIAEPCHAKPFSQGKSKAADVLLQFLITWQSNGKKYMQVHVRNPKTNKTNGFG